MSISLDGVLNSRATKQTLKKLEAAATEIITKSNELSIYSIKDFEEYASNLKKRVAGGESLDSVLIDAFAALVEGSSRCLGIRPYKVQIMAGVALYEGFVCEMRTGEGKTLSATLPAYLYSLAGRGVHVITANEYLAERDAAEMGVLYNFLGTTVGVASAAKREKEYKKEAYKAEITYGTIKEFGFDYLRDNMVLAVEDKVQRGQNVAIIDEVDAILIDESITPLIIAGIGEINTSEIYKISKLVSNLEEGKDYFVNEVDATVLLTEEGIIKSEEFLKLSNLYHHQHELYLMAAALEAKELFIKNRDYLVVNGSVSIIDDNTGRILDGRKWGNGVHAAVEAKEKVRIEGESHTLANITVQNYALMYEVLAGMTGTAEGDKEELESVYGLRVVQVPTNRPDIRKDCPDIVYATKSDKIAAIVKDVIARNKNGQPILVGTGSVDSSIAVSEALHEANISHQVLNAKDDKKEAAIIAEAGKLYAVTVATTMAGRGVDILLGGANGTPKDYEKVKAAGGLYVCGTERYGAKRIDQQLRGRCGRQGDPGESRFYLSLEDDLMERFGSKLTRSILAKTLIKGEPVKTSLVTKAINATQKTMEIQNCSVRAQLLSYDEVYATHRKTIYALRDKYLSSDNFDLHGQVEEVISDIISTGWCKTYPTEDEATQTNKTLLEYNISVLATKNTAKEDLLEQILFQAQSWDIGEVEKYNEIALEVVDTCWRQHLIEMDELRAGITLRAMGQKDPLVEWSNESFSMFKNLVLIIKQNILKALVTRTKEHPNSNDNNLLISDN